MPFLFGWFSDRREMRVEVMSGEFSESKKLALQGRYRRRGHSACV